MSSIFTSTLFFSFLIFTSISFSTYIDVQLPLDVSSQGELSISPKCLLLVAHEPSSVNTEPGPHIRGSTLRAYSVGEKEVDLLLPGTAR